MAHPQIIESSNLESAVERSENVMPRAIQNSTFRRQNGCDCDSLAPDIAFRLLLRFECGTMNRPAF